MKVIECWAEVKVEHFKVDSAEIFSCPPVEFDSSSESRLWRCLDEQDEDQLLRYVSNISLLSPLDPTATTTLV